MRIAGLSKEYAKAGDPYVRILRFGLGRAFVCKVMVTGSISEGGTLILHAWMRSRAHPEVIHQVIKLALGQ